MTQWSLPATSALFAVSAMAVWIVGTRLVRFVDQLSRRTGMGQGFAGMLVLGGIVSLTEISTVLTAAFSGSPVLALNNLLGSESINLFLLASIDPLSGREAMTSFIAKPALLLQGTLGIVLLSVVIAAMAVGDHPVLGVGFWSAGLFLLCLSALWLSARYEKRRVWTIAGEQGGQEAGSADPEQSAEAETGGSTRMLVMKLVALAAAIFVAGFLLSLTGDVIAEQTGLGASLVGFALVGTSTSLPELSTIYAAVKLKRHAMAVGDILGSNLFNLLLIPMADVVFMGDPVLNHAGRFEIVAAALGIGMTGILLLGMLERADRTVFRMGYDSLAMLLTFAGGVVLLYSVSG